MSENTAKIDGPAVHREAVERAGGLGEAAVAHAQSVKDALKLPAAPVSPHAPPDYPAPPYPAPPYPPVAAKSSEAPGAPEAQAPKDGDPIEQSLDAPDAPQE